MFGKMKSIAFGALGLGLTLTVYLGYRHYTGLIHKVSVAEQTNTVLKTALDIEQASVRDLQNAAGDWREDRTQLLTRIKEMQEAANGAELEKKHLQELFAGMDWRSAPADSVATATIDRLLGLIASSTERVDDRSGETDKSAAAGAEAD